MSTPGPVYLRWRREGAAAPEMERFDDLDAALDSLEARWAELRDKAPQVLDHRRVLLLSAEELRRELDEPADPPG
jgi:regulator of replication initiation timing